MTAQDRITTARITPGARIFVERTRSGALDSTTRRRDGVEIATVERVERIQQTSGSFHRSTRSRYNLHTDLGIVANLAPIQTFGVAPAADLAELVDMPTDEPAYTATPEQAGQAARELAAELRGDIPPIPATDPAPSGKRERRPSMAQAPILAAIAELGGVAVRHADILDQMTAWAGVGSWIALESAGWVTVDRGTPDNRGGILNEYRYTFTLAGWKAAGVDEAAIGTTNNGHAYAISRQGAWLTVATSCAGAVRAESAKGEQGAARAYRTLLDTFARRGELDDARRILANCAVWQAGDAAATAHESATASGYEGDGKYGWSCSLGDCHASGARFNTLMAAEAAAGNHIDDMRALAERAARAAGVAPTG